MKKWVHVGSLLGDEDISGDDGDEIGTTLAGAKRRLCFRPPMTPSIHIVARGPGIKLRQDLIWGHQLFQSAFQTTELLSAWH